MLEHSIAPATGVGYEIANSLRFNDDDSAYLSRTPSSAGNRKTWTWSGWVKKGVGGFETVFRANQTGNNYDAIQFTSGNQIRLFGHPDNTNVNCTTDAVFRDSSAWYHFMFVVDTTQATSSNRVKIYVNNELQTLSTATYPTQNEDLNINNTTEHRLSDANLDGYMAEVNFIDGQALDPTNFGETGDYGEWKPIEYTGTYGTNGFYLDFSNSGSLGADSSGNGNNWTPTNLAATDQMLDSPTNNFATMNVLGAEADQFTNQEGNLKSTTNVAAYNVIQGSFGVSTGKWYWEVEIQNVVGTNGGTGRCNIGIQNSNGNLNNYIGSDANGWAYNFDGLKLNSGAASYGASFTSGDIIGIALDMDAGTITFYKNNTSQGQAFSGITGEVHPAISAYQSGGYQSGGILNAGQDSSFAGNKTAQGNADGNGYGDFYYTPPTGYLALCTQNLPDPTVIPSEHFNTVLWTGNGTSQSITGVGFQPDLVWHKARSYTHWHGWVDAVRSNTKYIWSNTTSAEYTDATRVTSFDSDGFSVGSQANVNENGTTFVAWNWKANGAGVSNTNGSITSTVSANQDAGFSIVSYTGAAGTPTVGHGLSKAPEMIIVKNRNFTSSWFVYHASNTTAPETDYLRLNTTAATTDNSTLWNDTAPTSSVFTLGGDSGVSSRTSDNYIAYCFHSVDGYSKVGSYTGNGSADGTFVYTGFRPAYVMYKRSNSSGGWRIADNPRSGYRNEVDQVLRAESSSAEGNYAGTDVDFLSNGFKLRGTDSIGNTSGGNYIFIAFAEVPAKFSNAR